MMTGNTANLWLAAVMTVTFATMTIIGYGAHQDQKLRFAMQALEKKQLLLQAGDAP